MSRPKEEFGRKVNRCSDPKSVDVLYKFGRYSDPNSHVRIDVLIQILLFGWKVSKCRDPKSVDVLSELSKCSYPNSHIRTESQ